MCFKAKARQCLVRSRQASKGQKDMADIVPLLETYVHLRPSVSADVPARLV